VATSTSEVGLAQPGLFQPGAGAAAVPVFAPGARALATVGNRPYIGHLYTNAGVFKELIGPLVEAPAFKVSINGGHHPLTVQIASKDPKALGGDLLKLTEQGGDGTVVYAGIIEDLIEGTDSKTGYQLQLQPLVVELGDTPFSHEYYQQTDVAQMARDAVTQAISYGKHLSYTSASIPLTGITGIFSFVNATCLRVLEEAKKMAGPSFFYYVDENGLVTFGKADLGATTSSYSVQAQGALKVQAPATTLYNFLAAIGGTPLNATVPIASVYDAGVIRSGYPMALPSTAITSQFGVRARTDLAFDTNDQATLDQIMNTIGSQTNRVQTRVELTLIGFNQRIVPGATIRYYETGVYPNAEYRTGSAVYSPVYVVMDNEIDGIVQKVVCSDMPVSPDDLAYVIENRLRDALVATQVPSSLTPLSPFQLPTLAPLQPSPPSTYPSWGGSDFQNAAGGGVDTEVLYAGPPGSGNASNTFNGTYAGSVFDSVPYTLTKTSDVLIMATCSGTLSAVPAYQNIYLEPVVSDMFTSPYDHNQSSTVLVQDNVFFAGASFFGWVKNVAPGSYYGVLVAANNPVSGTSSVQTTWLVLATART